MMNSSDWTKRLKHLVTDRVTYYDNHFPGNCGEINPDGSISFDCIGMVKSVINDPGIVYKKSPAGYYVKPGTTIPDWSEIQILYCCSDIRWGNFSNCVNGEYLYMSGHAGVYFSGNTRFNVVECTPAWNGGVQYSWVDPDGTRRAYRGGPALGRWEAHGKLTNFIVYNDRPVENTEFIYQVYSDNVNRWLENMHNVNPDSSGDTYAGIFGDDIKAVLVTCNKGNVRYAVHTWVGDPKEWYGSGKWLPEVVNRSDFAGLLDQPADAFILFSDVPAKYRVRLRKTGKWLPWVYTKDASYRNSKDGFAGDIGQPFDALQIMPV